LFFVSISINTFEAGKWETDKRFGLKGLDGFGGMKRENAGVLKIFRAEFFRFLEAGSRTGRELYGSSAHALQLIVVFSVADGKTMIYQF